MRSGLWMKGLVVGIILLCVETSVVAGISRDGGIKNISEQSGKSLTDWWPMFHHDLAHSGYSTSTAPETNNVLWNYQTSYYVRSSPAVTDGKVYVGTMDGALYCLNASTGALIWGEYIGFDVDSSPAVANGMVYVSVSAEEYYGYICCLNADTGAWIWSYNVDAMYGLYSSPVVADGKVYIGVWGHEMMRFLCLNADTGAWIWEYPIYTGRSCPAIVNGKVYVGGMAWGSGFGALYCLNASTGAFIWDYPTSGWEMCSPAVVNGKAYVGSTDTMYGSHWLYCLNADTGAWIWDYETTDYGWSSPAIAGGKVYVGSYGEPPNGYITCLNADNGTLIWSYNIGSTASSPAVADGKVYIGSSGDGKVYCFNAYTGALLWDYQTGSQVSSSPAIANSKVYVGSDDYNVYCFGVSEENQSVVQASSYTIKRGMYSSGDLADLYESDDQCLSILAGFTITSDEPPVWVEIEGTAPLNTPSQLMFTLEAHKNSPGMIMQIIKLFNYTTGNYEIFDSRSATLTDQVVTIILTDSAVHYIHPETKQMKAQYMWKQTGPASMFPWKISIDESNWAIWS